MMTDTSGRLFEMPLLTFDPDGSSSRTSPAMSPSDLDRFFSTWLRSGSMRNGEFWEAPMLGDAIDDSDSGSLLPTPRVAAMRTGRSAATRLDSRSGPSLEQAVEIAAGRLPREFETWEELPASWQKDIPLLPTPVARDDGKSPEAHLAMEARMGNRYSITSLEVLARAGWRQPKLDPT